MSRTARLARAGATTSLTAVNAVLTIPTAYLGGITLIGLAANRRVRQHSTTPDPITRFVVLIPAHNEASTISTTLASLGAQNYPTSLSSVHVVADNCTDDTAAVVRSSGFDVHERFDPTNPGKGPALNWLLRRLLSSDLEFDVAVFIDADTTAAPDFLGALDRRFAAGAQAVQGHYGVREAFDSVPATLRYCALACRHHLRPLGRNAIGGSCGLFGNGMAFHRDLIATRQWTDHLVEDMEFQIELLLAGVVVEYEPNAVVEAEMPHTFEAGVTQHRRWETGRAQVVRTYLPRMLSRVARPGPSTRIAAADAAVDMCVPPLSLLAAATTVSAGAGLAMAVCSSRRIDKVNAALGLAFVATIAVHVTAALRVVRAPRQAYQALLHAPQLALWKILLLVRGGRRQQQGEWIRTRRNAEAPLTTSAGVAS